MDLKVALVSRPHLDETGFFFPSGSHLFLTSIPLKTIKLMNPKIGLCKMGWL